MQSVAYIARNIEGNFLELNQDKVIIDTYKKMYCIVTSAGVMIHCGNSESVQMKYDEVVKLVRENTHIALVSDIFLFDISRLDIDTIGCLRDIDLYPYKLFHDLSYMVTRITNRTPIKCRKVEGTFFFEYGETVQELDSTHILVSNFNFLSGIGNRKDIKRRAKLSKKSRMYDLSEESESTINTILNDDHKLHQYMRMIDSQAVLDVPKP